MERMTNKRETDAQCDMGCDVTGARCPRLEDENASKLY